MASTIDGWGSIRNDTSTATYDNPPSETLPLTGLYLSSFAFFSVLIIISNSIVVMVVVFCRDLHLPTLWNIAFMATCDLLYSLHFLIFSIPSLYKGKFAYSEKMIPTASMTMTFLFGQNFFNIFLSIVDRYIAVCWPLRYHCLMSAKRFMIAVLILVVINIARLCIINFPDSDLYYNKDLGICLQNFNTMAKTSASVGFPFLTAMSIAGLLVKIGLELRKSNRIHPTTSNSQSKQFTRTMCLAGAMFLLSYIPSWMSIIMNLILGLDNISIAFTRFSINLMLCNGLWNVLIYAATYRPFRDGVLRLFCKKIFRDRARREANIASSTGTSSSAWTVNLPGSH